VTSVLAVIHKIKISGEKNKVIPEVLYRGASREIQEHVIGNYGKEQPLGPGIYTTDSLKTAYYYTSGGRSVYKLMMRDTYVKQPDGVIFLSKRLSEQSSSVQTKIKAILSEYYGFLKVDESRYLMNLLFYREKEVEQYNLDRKIAHEKHFDGSPLRVLHLCAQIFLSFLKTKACELPVARTAPKTKDVVNSLVAAGIWIGVGTIEGTNQYSGSLDAGLQYLLYDENAISESIELTEAQYRALCKESGIWR